MATRAALFSAAAQQRLYCPDNPAISMGDNESWVSAWVKLTDKLATYCFFSKRHNATVGNGEHASFYDASRDLMFSALFCSPQGNVNAESPDHPVAGRWYFLLSWFSKVDNRWRLRINNGAIFESPSIIGPFVTGTLNDSIGPFSIGSQFTVPSQSVFLNGAVALVGFGKSPPGGIDGVIDSISARLYNSGFGLPYSQIEGAEKTAWGLQAYWNLDEQSNGSAPVPRLDSHGTSHLTDENNVASTLGPSLPTDPVVATITPVARASAIVERIDG